MKKNLVKFISVVSVGMMFSIPNVFAKSTDVLPGVTTLETAVENAESGDVLSLSKGTYGDEKHPVTINKDLTIQGNSETVINCEIIIDDEDDTPNNVVIRNIRSEPNTKKINWNYINVVKKVNLTLENVNIMTIARWEDLINPLKQTVLNIEDADGSQINIKKSIFSIFYDGIRLASSNVDMNISDNSYISGQKAFDILNGEKNTITVNKSTIYARSTLHENEEAISIENEKYLTINLIDTTVTGNDSKSKGAEYIFSLEGETPCSNVKLNITGESKIIDENNVPGSAIFNFGKSNTADNSNVVYVENCVDIVVSKNNKESLITVPYKYNVDDDYVVVGVYDNKGNLTVKAYEKNAKINKEELPGEKEGYKLKGYQFIDDDTNEKKEFNLESKLTKNMDIYANYVKLYNVTIDGVEGTFEVEENTKYGDFKGTDAVKDKISALENIDTKNFAGFYDQDNEKIDDDYIFNKDVIMTAHYQVEIKIGEETFTFNEGETLDSNSQILEIVDGYINDKTKHYACLVDENGDVIDLDKELHRNMTLSPKYGMYIQIGEESFYFETLNHKLSELNSEDLDRLNSLIEFDNKTFDHFEDENGKVVDMETELNENTKLTPKFTISVKINSEKNILDEGQSLNKLPNLDNFKNKENRKFLRFEDLDGNEVKENSPLNENTDLKSVFTLEVTINTEKYDLIEGQTLESNEEIKNALEALKKNKKEFSRFVDEKGNTVEVNVNINEPLTIKALYKNIVTVGDEEFKLEDGQQLSDDENIVNALNKLKNVSDKQFKEFVVNNEVVEDIDYNTIVNDNIIINANYTITITIADKGTFTFNEGETLDSNSRILEIVDGYINDKIKHYACLVDETGEIIDLNKELHRNMTLSPKYGMIIKIGEESFYFETLNHKLSELNSEDLDRLNSLIEFDNKTFDHFEDENGKVVDMETELNENTKLTPKFTISVKINSEKNILDEGQSLNKLPNLDNFKNKENRKFLRFEDLDGNEVKENSPLNGNIEVNAIFGVKVTIENTKEEFYLAEGNFAEQNLDLLKVLDDLIYSEDFSRLVDEKGNTITTITPITDNITLTALYFKYITIADEEFKLEEGQQLSNDENVVNALNKLKNVSNKQFKEFVVNSEVVEDLDYNMVVNNNMIIKANYSIRVSIDSKEQLLDEGQSLSDLPNLDNFKNKENRKFLRFEDLDGNEVKENSPLNENTDLKSVFTLEVTINTEKYDLIEGQTLESNEEIKNALEALKKNKKEFSRFVDEKGNTVEVNVNINEPLTIKALYKNIVTVGDEEFKLEDGQQLSDDENIVNALNKLKNVNNKQFKEFVVNNEVVEDLDYNTIVNDDIIIKANYSIIIKLNDHEFVLDENSKLSDLTSEELSLIENIMKEERFIKFVDENGNTILLDTVLNENKILSIKRYIVVTIGDEEFKLEEGQSLNNLSDEDKQRLEKLMKHDETKEFKGFKDLKTANEITLDTLINEDVNLEVIFSDVLVNNEIDNNNISNPQTVDNIMTYVMMAVISLIVLIFGIKTSLKKLNK